MKTLDYIAHLEVGEVQAYHNVAAVPLYHTAPETLAYGTLAEALRSGDIIVTEVSTGGSVPDLKVVNNADYPVLLLDGEELAGAKQNRVLNASVLLDVHSETIIPVSCTESGRWSYRSNAFTESGYFMPRNLRARRTHAVSASLGQTRGYRSDQSAVWNDIDRMAEAAAVRSPTSAMADIFAAKEGELDDCLAAFPVLPDQKGLLVFVNGTVVGFDVLSRAAAYEELHPKLIKSYVMDALLLKKTRRCEATREEAQKFISETQTCSEKRYKSAGLGWDHRFEGATIIGSSLVHDDATIHSAFFSAQQAPKADHMANYSRRAAYRMRRTAYASTSVEKRSQVN
ncbi:MAG: ARPP-1 family domain-containing protein [Halobacteriota archaeon]